MKKIDKNLKVIIIVLIIFLIWSISAFFITISRNQDWFNNTEPVVSESVVEKEEIETTNKNEFTYALAWSKYGNNWVCVNIDGRAEIVLDEQYTEVTDFCNSGYAIVRDANGMKSLIDRAGNLRLSEYSYVCDEIITDSFQANMTVATKDVRVNGEVKKGYGIINSSLDWCKMPAVENEYLKEFTKGIDGGVFSNETGDKLYFYTLDKVVENVDEFLFYNNEIAMFRRGTEIYLIDKSGEHERVSMKNIAKAGEWTEGTIFCELTDGRKVFNDINGTIILDVTNLNIINSPRFINDYAGILMQTPEGTKYTVIDIKGNMMFEPRLGNICDTLTGKFFRVSYFNESEARQVLGVMNENGELVFEVSTSITNFTNGYAIKDNNSYVRTDGTELVITKDK